MTDEAVDDEEAIGVLVLITPLQHPVAMLVFTISNAVITVFTDAFTGVSKVRTVNRLCTDYY